MVWPRISAEGVTYHPRHYDALTTMDVPVTAAQLSSFISSANWMRDSINNFALVFKPMYDKLQDARSSVNSVKNSHLKGVVLSWTEKEKEAFNKYKAAIVNQIKKGFHNQFELFVCCDACDTGFGLFIAQVKKWDNTKTLVEQQYIPFSLS